VYKHNNFSFEKAKEFIYNDDIYPPFRDEALKNPNIPHNILEEIVLDDDLFYETILENPNLSTTIITKLYQEYINFDRFFNLESGFLMGTGIGSEKELIIMHPNKETELLNKILYLLDEKELRDKEYYMVTYAIYTFANPKLSVDMIEKYVEYLKPEYQYFLLYNPNTPSNIIDKYFKYDSRILFHPNISLQKLLSFIPLGNNKIDIKESEDFVKVVDLFWIFSHPKITEATISDLMEYKPGFCNRICCSSAFA